MTWLRLLEKGDIEERTVVLRSQSSFFASKRVGNRSDNGNVFFGKVGYVDYPLPFNIEEVIGSSVEDVRDLDQNIVGREAISTFVV